MTKNATVYLSVVMLVLMLCVFPVIAALPPPLEYRLQGERINLFVDSHTIQVDQAAHVVHGWNSAPDEYGNPLYPDEYTWSEFSREHKTEFLQTARFDLYIDDVQMELGRLRWYSREEDQMYLWYYIQFDAFNFDPGDYLFRGVWSIEIESELIVFERTTMVEFTLERTLLESGTDIEPFSGHTKCESVWFLNKYWIYFDWVPEGGDSWDPNVYMMSSNDAKTWDGPFPIAEEIYPEHSVKVTVGRRGLLYVTYQMDTDEGHALYYRASRNGIDYSEPTKFYDISGLPGPGIHGVDHDIIWANELFYLVYSDPVTGDIMLTQSPEMGFGWNDPVQVTDTEVTDFSPELCFAKGKLWLFWDHGPGHAYAYVKSFDFLSWTWSEEALIPPMDSSFEYWGPFTVLYTGGQFIFLTRAHSHELGYPFDSWLTWEWRLFYSTSDNGIDWSPFAPVADPSLDLGYAEKGPTIFRVVEPEADFDYSVVFKRYWFDGPYEVVQVPLDL